MARAACILLPDPPAVPAVTAGLSGLLTDVNKRNILSLSPCFSLSPGPDSIEHGEAGDQSTESEDR